MGIYLNSRVPFDAYESLASDLYFVDKSALLCELIPSIGKENRFFCITRPRRFGKSVMANMVAAFFGRSVNSEKIFDGLEIADTDMYRKHLNQYDIIYIDFSEEPENCQSYEDYIARITNGLKADLADAYPHLMLDVEKPLWDIMTHIFQTEGGRFVFIMDEWDAPFYMPYVTQEEHSAYLRFLKLLLKGKRYATLAYMTGILPITKYSSGSELNMFVEYDMATRKRFGEYFGFTDSEVDDLYGRYQVNVSNPEILREDLKNWYDGYYTVSGEKIYNPRSVVCALSDNDLANYWTGSGPYDEIFYYVRNNIKDIRDDLVLLIAGEGIEAKVENYAAASMELYTKDEIYSAMVVYGLLTYHEGKVYIPNREIMEQFQKLLMSKPSLGYVYNLARESEKMLKATLSGDTETMAGILKYVHDTESPIFSYNSEIELCAVVNLVYLAARDKYRVEREDKAGEGYVDFVFYPERKNEDAILLELKVDSTPEDAIRQIKNKRYDLCLTGRFGERPKFTGRILAVGISYDRKSKEHACKVEVL